MMGSDRNLTMAEWRKGPRPKNPAAHTPSNKFATQNTVTSDKSMNVVMVPQPKNQNLFMANLGCGVIQCRMVMSHK